MCMICFEEVSWLAAWIMQIAPFLKPAIQQHYRRKLKPHLRTQAY